MSITNKIFLNSPIFLKKLLVNIESIRRDRFRRWGDFKKLYSQIDLNEIFPDDYSKINQKKFYDIMKYVKIHVPAYQEYGKVELLDDIEKLPILRKESYIKNTNSYISEEIDLKHVYKGKTSGSTGKPLIFYKDKKSIRYNHLYADKIIELIGLNKNLKECRFSGVTLFKPVKEKPPFWIYISRYNQLQCSSYHLNESNFMNYLEAMKYYGVNYGTGYAKTWLNLAEYIIATNYINPPKLKAIITDSEGVNDSQQDIIEKAFSTTVHQTYGLGEVGQIAFQCSDRNYHVIPHLAYIETIDSDNISTGYGEQGELIVTSLYSKKTPFIRYATADLGIIGENNCNCGLKGQTISRIEGRIEDYVLTNDNRKINRLSLIMKPAKGVVNSQLVQENPGNLTINVVPGVDFEPSSMKEVITVAKSYLDNMKIEWKLVEQLERTNNGKIKFVIRKF